LETTPKIDLIYFDAGGGHRSAALALQSVIAAQNRPWRLRLVNLQEVLDSLDVFRKLTGIRLEDIYNLALAKGWTLGSTYLLPFMHAVIRLYHPAQVKLLARFWEEYRPDMVVSLVPNFNRALFQSLERALPGTPFATILTDLADYPPHFWMEKQEQYLVCGTERAVQQALAIGHQPSHVFRTSGMILRPEFYEPQQCDRAAELVRLKLDPNLPTGLVLFGGEGSNVMLRIAERLGNSSTDLQLIMICGRNSDLRGHLGRLQTRNKLFLEGFTKQIPYYMHLSDFFIGKPGPGSISESVQMKLPVIVERNSWTLPQERYNADWVREKGVGIVLENFREIETAVKNLLADHRLEAMRQRIGTMNNQAVYEIPPLLERILQEAKRK
jgi:hypothetical protein